MVNALGSIQNVVIQRIDVEKLSVSLPLCDCSMAHTDQSRMYRPRN